MKQRRQDYSYGPAENEQILLLSIGSIVGAGFFVGTRSSFAMAGPSLILTFFLIGTVAVIVNLFLIEMSLCGQKSLYFHQYVALALGPKAGMAVACAYILSMLVGQISELLAANMLLEQCVWDLGVPALHTKVMILITVVIGIIPHKLLARLESFVAFVKMFLLLSFGLIGLASILSLFSSQIASVGTIRFSSLSDIFPNGLRGTLAAGVGVIMMYGGTESIGLFEEKERSGSSNMLSLTYNIALRMVFVYTLATTALVGVLPYPLPEGVVSPLIYAMMLLGFDRTIGAIITIVVLLSIFTLAVSDLFLAGRLFLRLFYDSSLYSRENSPISREKASRAVGIIVRLLLFFALILVLIGNLPYTTLFHLSGLGFLFIWIMLALAFPKYCKKVNTARTPAKQYIRHPVLLQGIVLVTLSLCVLCFFLP